MDNNETQTTPPEETDMEKFVPDHSTVAGVSLRGWIAVMVVLTVCLMSGLAIKIEEPLYTLAGLIIGFYFGQNPKRNA